MWSVGASLYYLSFEGNVLFFRLHCLASSFVGVSLHYVAFVRNFLSFLVHGVYLYYLFDCSRVEVLVFITFLFRVLPFLSSFAIALESRCFSL